MVNLMNTSDAPSEWPKILEILLPKILLPNIFIADGASQRF